MIGRLAKMFAYVKAPVKTFAALHPLRFLKYAAFVWVGKKLWDAISGGREGGRRRLPATSGGGTAATRRRRGGDAA